MASKKNPTNSERILKSIKGSINNQTEILAQRLSQHQEKIGIFDRLINSGETTVTNKVIAILARGSEFNELSRLFSELFMLKTFQSLTINVRILEISLEETGLLEKAKEIGDVATLKTKLNEAIEQLNSFYEKKKEMDKQIEESQSKCLEYIK